MNLDIDIGNTRLKWRLLSAKELSTGAFTLGSELSIDQLVEKLGQQLAELVDQIRRVRIASVKSADFESRLEKALWDRIAVEVEFARTEASVSRNGIIIKNSYLTPSDMGVDRWCAIVAGAIANQGRACCVVDAGSAVTIDCVSGSGEHLGGYIFPGFAMQVRALLANTDRVRAEDVLSRSEQQTNPVSPGLNTVAAVRAGVWLNLHGAIMDVLRQNPWQIESGELSLIITGGDGKTLYGIMQDKKISQESFVQKNSQAELLNNVTYSPSLVFDGLGYLLP